MPAVLAQPALISKASYADSFDRADSSTSAGPNWTNQAFFMGVSGNTGYPVTSSQINAATWNFPMATNDHKVSGTISGTWTSTQLMLHMGAATNLIAMLTAAVGSLTIYTMTGFNEAGVVSQATATGLTIVSGDVLSIERSGSTFTARQNGTSRVTWNDTTPIMPRDANHRIVGMGGFWYDTSPTMKWADWSAIDI